MYMYVCVPVCMCMYVCMCTCMYVCMYVCMCVCTEAAEHVLECRGGHRSKRALDI